MTPPIPWWAALAFGAALSGPLGYLLGRRVRAAHLRRHERELSEECIAIALLAAEAGDHPRALSWLRHARGLAPANATLARQEAWCLGEMGRVEEALQTYAEAASGSDEGFADFDAALLLLRHGREAARAEDRLARALHRTPVLALEAQTMREFDALRGRPAFEAAMARALASLPTSPPSRGRGPPP